MSLSGYQNINSAVRYSTDGFNFAETLGDFVGNAEFSYGVEDYKQDMSAMASGTYVAPNARSNIWHVLSAIGQDLGEVTYANVKNYIDVVSNIDMCKTRSLMSMMKNVGMDYSIIGDIGDFPLEVLNLIDIFSIDKKYLLDNDKIKSDLIADIIKYASVEEPEDSEEPEDPEEIKNAQVASGKDYYRLFRNGFYLSSADPLGKNQLVMDIDNGYDEGDLSVYDSMADLVRAGGDIYNLRTGFAIYRKYKMLPGAGPLSCDIYKFGVPTFSDGHYRSRMDIYAVVSADRIICSADADAFESAVLPNGEGACPFDPDRPDIAVKYIDLRDGSHVEPFQISEAAITNEKYFNYVKSVFAELLSSYLEMRYNVTSVDIGGGEILPIYCYIKDEYLQNSNYYKNRAQLTSDSMQFKRINNIPLSFNEQSIVDNIDAGADSLENYTGSFRQLLDIEIARRARRLTQVGNNDKKYSWAFLPSDNFDDISNNKTRYSYYRKAKVLEYARFVDNIFALGEMGSTSSVEAFKPYRFD